MPAAWGSAPELGGSRGACCKQVKRARPRRPGGWLPCLPYGACGLRGGGAGRAAGSGIRDAAVHRTAGRGVGSGSEAARHCWGGRGQRVRAGAGQRRARLDPLQSGADPPPRSASTCGPVPARGRRDDGYRSPPQPQPPASWRRRGGALRPGLGRRRSAEGAGPSPRPQCLGSSGPLCPN